MRVLMTGGSPMQVGSKRTVLKFYSVTHAIRDVLTAMGHEVEVRPPRVDDPTSGEYDLVIAGLACVASMNGQWSHYVYKWIGEYEKQSTPLALYMDDWHMKPLISTLGSILRQPERVTSKAQAFARPTLSWLTESPSNVDSVIAGAQAMDEGRWPPFLVHRFPWGDRGILLEGAKITDAHDLDISGFYPAYPFEPPTHRAQVWLYPRLLGIYDAWLQKVQPSLGWSVAKLGNVRLGEQVVPESHISQYLCESGGTLIPSNSRHVGSGIWRPRFLQAAHTRTFQYADPGEGTAALDPSLAVTPAHFEAVDAAQREAVARHQSKVILGAVWSRQQAADAMHAFLSRVTGRDLGDPPTVAPAAGVEVVDPPRPPVLENLNRELTPRNSPRRNVNPRRGAEPGAEKPRREPKPRAEKPAREPRVVVPRGFRSATEYAALAMRPGDVVLDVGAHRGEFVALAIGAGVERIEAYEPEPSNYGVLLERYGDDERVVGRQCAVVHTDDKTVQLWLCNGADTTMHSLLQRRGRQAVEVPAKKFSEVLATDNWTVVKLAVEGYENVLLRESRIPDSVRAVGVKFHPSTEDSRVRARWVVSYLEERGFRPVAVPNLDVGSWPVVGVWRRYD